MSYHAKEIKIQNNIKFDKVDLSPLGTPVESSCFFFVCSSILFECQKYSIFTCFKKIHMCTGFVLMCCFGNCQNVSSTTDLANFLLILLLNYFFFAFSLSRIFLGDSFRVFSLSQLWCLSWKFFFFFFLFWIFVRIL